MPSPSEVILGYAVTTGSAAECARLVLSEDRAGCRWLACLNPHSWAVAQQDPAFDQSLRLADLIVPDGVGMVLASRVQRGTIRNRVTGHDVFDAVMSRLQEMRGSVFFLGSTAETLSLIERRCARDFPSVRFAGSYSPPVVPEFTGPEQERMIAAVNIANADVLWVGLTAPKQEKWLAACAPRLNVRFAGAIGAVFDFYAGTVPRPAATFQRLGLEWLPRLVRQPRRLWRRMGVSAPLFMLAVMRAGVLRHRNICR